MAQRILFLRPNGIFGLVLMIAVFVALFFLAKGVFTLLSWVAPVLILLAAIINYRTILNYLKYMLGLLRRNPLGGILGVVLSVIGFPVLAAVLFGKSILDRKIGKLQQGYRKREQDEFVEYEEIIRREDQDTLDLPPMEKKNEPPANPYKDIF